jgi:hypothetical protein
LVAVGVASEPTICHARIDSLTSIAGATGGLDAELGYGPHGSDPATTGGWAWTSATYNYDVAGSDQLRASLTVSMPGQYDYCFRVRYTPESSAWLYADLDGSANGYSPAQAGDLVVVGPTAPQVRSDWWSTDGEVRAVALDGNTLYCEQTSESRPFW